MIPINNSDTAWLVVADWNQENGKYYEELRADVYSIETDQWHCTWRSIRVGTMGGVGGSSSGSRDGGGSVGANDLPCISMVHGGFSTLLGDDVGGNDDSN